MVATRPAMAARVQDLEPARVPEGVEIVPVTDPELLAGLVDVEVGAFETDRPVAEGLLAPSQLSLPNVRLYAALADGRAVAQAVTNTQGGAVGVFGVATLPEYRRRGIGTAITAFAIDDVRDEADLAWLQSTDRGRPLYERMGFRPVSDWDVWVRP
jgi:GNAT superfamily N-acetyltransferase